MMHAKQFHQLGYEAYWLKQTPLQREEYVFSELMKIKQQLSAAEIKNAVGYIHFMKNGSCQPTNNSTLLTQEEVRAIVEKELGVQGLVYDKDKSLWPTYYAHYELRDGVIASIWSVAFVSPARTVPFRGKIVEVAEKMYFAIVNDTTGKLLYIHHSTGYIE